MTKAEWKRWDFSCRWNVARVSYADASTHIYTHTAVRLTAGKTSYWLSCFVCCSLGPYSLAIHTYCRWRESAGSAAVAI